MIGGSLSRNKKIRIKTLNQNPMKSRNNYSQNLKYNIKSSNENQLMASMTGMKNFNRIKGPKTYYNIYEKTGKHDDRSLYNSRSIWGTGVQNISKKRNEYPVYTQLGFNKNGGISKRNRKTDIIGYK